MGGYIFFRDNNISKETDLHLSFLKFISSSLSFFCKTNWFSTAF